MSEQIEPSLKKGRGRSKRTLALIEAMYKIAEETRPITGRGIGYKLFAGGLITGMNEMNIVYRALKVAREDGVIPWDWIRRNKGPGTGQHLAKPVPVRRRLLLSPRPVADTAPHRRGLGRERHRAWRAVAGIEQARCRLPRSARVQQCHRRLAGFEPGNDDRPLIALYIGDWDPSGLCMSEHDLPKRIKEYGGDHIRMKRIALTADQTASLPSFSVESKHRDTRYKWFKQNYGDQCWELDAMDPRDLRSKVESEINALIDRDLWGHQEAHQEREKKSIESLLRWWANVETLRGAASV